MSESVIEMTRDELVAENRDLRAKEREMQSHIDCLKTELAEAQLNKLDLPFEPIEVASMLIKATVTCKTSLAQKAFNKNCPDEYEDDRYSDKDLRQIAEHLLLYCNNAEAK